MFDLKSLSRLPQFETRSISPENRTGERAGGARTPLEAGTARNAARDLGAGWKVNPYLHLEAGETLTLADIQGSGVIRHIWLTPTGAWRSQILRFYWDDSDVPAVECPLGDFFACGWGEYAQVSSLAVCVNPGSAFNSYWEMPFRRRARVTLENRGAERGLYAGTYMAWGVHNSGWWGEGEIKFFLDGDEEFPTICGTGTEDYFCGSYNFENQKTHEYQTFTTPYTGLCQVLRPDGVYRSQTRFGLYRWHIPDPIHFEEDIRVTLQQIGVCHRGLFERQDDVATVAYWYQDKPYTDFPPLPEKEERWPR